MGTGEPKQRPVVGGHLLDGCKGPPFVRCVVVPRRRRLSFVVLRSCSLSSQCALWCCDKQNTCLLAGGGS